MTGAATVPASGDLSSGPKVSLPMYTAAGPATLQRFWGGLAQLLRKHGLQSVPTSLHSPGEELRSHWLDPHLLLSQACGYPYVHCLQARGVQLVGAFRYAAPGCSGVRYRSFLVCRQDDPGRRLMDFRGRVAVVNAFDSHSGCNALRAALAEALAGGEWHGHRFFADVPVSGSHAMSLQWVRDGRADVAAIDCVSLASFIRYMPKLMDELRILGETPDAPGLPLVAGPSVGAADMALLREALHAAMEERSLAMERDRLLITGFEPLTTTTYSEIALVERNAAARGIVF